MAFGFNCALGAEQMKLFVQILVDLLIFISFVTLTPPPKKKKNFSCSTIQTQGLPNAMENYDENPEAMSKNVEPFSKEGLVTIVGGCCGTLTYDTIY